MWFKKPISDSEVKNESPNPSVPQPPYKDSSSEFNILTRDNESDVQQTLQRLKSSQVNSTTSGYKQIKTASALISEDDHQRSLRRKSIITLLGILVLLTMGAIFASMIGLDQNRPILRTGQSGIRFDGQELMVSVSESQDLLTELSAQDNSERYFITFTPDSNTGPDISSVESTIFDQLGFEFGPDITDGIYRKPVLQYQVVNNKPEFVLAFMTRDLANLQNGLRNWEAKSVNINQNLVTSVNSNLFGVRDLTYSNLDYRIISDNLGYTIDNAELALIGSSPEVIESSRQRLRQQILQID